MRTYFALQSSTVQIINDSVICCKMDHSQTQTQTQTHWSFHDSGSAPRCNQTKGPFQEQYRCYVPERVTKFLLILLNHYHAILIVCEILYDCRLSLKLIYSELIKVEFLFLLQSINICKKSHNIQLKEYLFMVFVNGCYHTHVTKKIYWISLGQKATKINKQIFLNQLMCNYT